MLEKYAALRKSKPEPEVVDTEDLAYGGEAFKQMLGAVSIDGQLAGLKAAIKTTKSVAKRDDFVKQIKYLHALKAADARPEESFILHNMPILPPIARPTISQAGNRLEHSDVTHLYQDHIMAVKGLDALKDDLMPDQLVEQRRALYEGAKAIVGVGEAIGGKSKAQGKKGFLKQIGGELGPKTGFFQSRILSKKQDFSARATIYAEPNLGFNEIAAPEDMLWTLYEFHIIRDLVKVGYRYPEAKKAVEEKTPAAKASFAKLIKQIPIIANRAPTLMQSNVTAHFPVPVKGKTLGINPLHLPLYAGDFDGDAMTVHVPITPEAIEEAKKKLLPEQHIYDFREGLGNSHIAPGHEAIVGAVHLTEPDMTKAVRSFRTEEDALAAYKRGEIDENTPIKLGV
jgi:DNA-directed RNA polymerase beta' subunit